MRESEVFLMRNTKRELNPYSFYDTEGLARHFERMAAEGWAPDRVGLFIRYRRIKPQKLRFAIDHADRALVAGRCAQTAAVAFFRINFYNSSYHINSSSFLFVCI